MTTNEGSGEVTMWFHMSDKVPVQVHYILFVALWRSMGIEASKKCRVEKLRLDMENDDEMMK